VIPRDRDADDRRRAKRVGEGQQVETANDGGGGAARAVPATAGNAAVGRLLDAAARADGADRPARAALGGSSGAGNGAVARLLSGTAGGSEALPDRFRADAEAGLGADLSEVRVHRDAVAADAARGVSAQAFTVGPDIYFGRGRFDPDSDQGRRLLAHELTHVLQQRDAPSGGSAAPGLSEPGDATERAAEAAAGRFAAGLAPERPMAAPVTVARQVDAGAPDAGVPDAGTPGSRVIDVGGTQLSTDPETARTQFRNVATNAGIDAARRLLDDAIAGRSRSNADRSSMNGVTPELEAATAAVHDYDAVIAVMEAELASWRDFVSIFETRARLVATQLLATSEERVRAERDRYGLTATETTMTMPTEFGPVDASAVTYGMAANPETAAMADAARQLAGALVPLESAVERLNLVTPYDGPVGEFYIGGPEPVDPAVLQAAQEAVRRAAEQYALLRNEKEAAFPVLASFAGYENLDGYALKNTRQRLEQVGRGAAGGEATAAIVAGDVTGKLENIAKVRAALASGELNVWGADNLVGLTKIDLAVGPASLRERVIDQQVADDKSSRSLRELLIGAFAFALGLAAAPLTGGGSLAVAAGVTAAAGGAALSSYLAVEHLQQYQLESAANATDFDKARVVSSQDPSLFWLAIDIVGVVGDLGAALRAFGKLAPLARAVVNAGGEAAPALDALQAAAEAERPGLGAAVRHAAQEQGERQAAQASRVATAGAPPGGAPVPTWEELIAKADDPTPRQTANGFRSQTAAAGNRQVVKIEGQVGPPISQDESFAGYVAKQPGEHGTHAVGMQLGENLPEGIASAPGADLNLSALKKVENATRQVYERAQEVGASVETETFALIEKVPLNGEDVPVMVGVIRRAWLRMPGSDTGALFVDFEARVDVATRRVTVIRNNIGGGR
jgi:hypothetical protein